VRYEQENGKDKTVKFTGTGSFTFKATDAPFKIEILPEDDFIGKRTTLGIGEPAEVVVSKWDPKDDRAVEFVSMYTTGKNTAPTPTWTLTGVSDDS
jgi:hypothetical protein